MALLFSSLVLVCVSTAMAFTWQVTCADTLYFLAALGCSSLYRVFHAVWDEVGQKSRLLGLRFRLYSVESWSSWSLSVVTFDVIMRGCLIGEVSWLHIMWCDGVGLSQVVERALWGVEGAWICVALITVPFSWTDWPVCAVAVWPWMLSSKFGASNAPSQGPNPCVFRAYCVLEDPELHSA